MTKSRGIRENNVKDRLSLVTKSISKFGEGAIDYSDVVYLGASVKCQFKCVEHGIKYWQTPSSHLVGKTTGCPACVKRLVNKGLTNKGKVYDGNSFARKSVELNKEMYDHSLAVLQYETSIKDVQIFCNTCCRYFWQRPNNHLNSRGCPSCSKDSMRDRLHYNNVTSLLKKPKMMYKETYLYILMMEDFINEKMYYKVGISYSHRLNKRMKTIMRDSKFVVAPIYLFKSTRYDCQHFEESFHKTYKDRRINVDNEFAGVREVYYQDIYGNIESLVKAVNETGTFQEVDVLSQMKDLLDYLQAYVDLNKENFYAER